jgi:hypothetical protein
LDDQNRIYHHDINGFADAIDESPEFVASSLAKIQEQLAALVLLFRESKVYQQITLDDLEGQGMALFKTGYYQTLPHVLFQANYKFAYRQAALRMASTPLLSLTPFQFAECCSEPLYLPFSILT